MHTNMFENYNYTCQRTSIWNTKDDPPDQAPYGGRTTGSSEVSRYSGSSCGNISRLTLSFERFPPDNG